MCPLKYKLVIQHHINSSHVKKTKIQKYFLINKKFLHVNDKINFNIYYYESPHNPNIIIKKRTIFDIEHKKKIDKVHNLYILQADTTKYEFFIRNHLNNIANDKDILMDEKAKIVYETTTILVNSIYAHPGALENVQISKDIVNPILQSVLYSDDAISSYIKIIEYDYCTHTHSLNVTIYALCLGMALDVKEDKLRDLGRSALLHDLGKSQIDHTIVDKHGTLTRNEYAYMKMHPTLGYEMALNIGIKNEDILDGILHHHESINGDGYPDGLIDEMITLFPRIIKVCDIFDALTTKRSYKKAMKSYDALYLMKAHMPHQMDIKILDVFIKTLHGPSTNLLEIPPSL